MTDLYVYCPVCDWCNDHTHVDANGDAWCWKCGHEWKIGWKPAPVQFEISWVGVLIAFSTGYLIVKCFT